MTFLVFILGGCVGAAITYKVVAARLRTEQEAHWWTKERLRDAQENLTKVSEKLNKVIRNPEVARRWGEQVDKIRAKRRYPGSKQ